MKYSSRILSLLALVSMTVFFAGCDKGDDNKKSAKDQEIAKLVGTWQAVAGGVEYENAPQASYDDFEITISGDAGDDALGFTTDNRPAGTGPWDGSGELSFQSPISDHVLLTSEGVEVHYTVTATTLLLDFNYEGTGFGGGRVGEIEGQWEFNLVKVE
jgi:hypothetical protein